MKEKYLIMRLLNVLPMFFLITGLLGCDGNKKSVEKKPLTGEQVAANQCFEQVINKKIEFTINISQKEAELIASGQSRVPLAIMRRRQEEQFCAAEARCLGLKEPLYSAYFSSCLNQK